ncbi:putative transcription factor C2H2 family [Helianthus annuus]|uniref:Transcription factor C2H2 family n=2 Tax=Helianthus annuus TaxID=4232 RepID=A0A9K3E8V1_HELAN|nr:RING-H2 finger protein ATL80 [Helianthus annuus]KAF5769102.1 putative transcription factor C2H2 family [Helianthus annuus]KAJ0464193.1 putative transcription factor C2H2 family [Helianthus annuus]KAJ0468628.1 putative transcription factor C2H2 family [Helianthus annuus]KAJ0485767.1 putative transcription factor C2H2 family [Helianthus annuus]KAJ0656319.1 putative transcription factor C2H2 family [Helianthus annuus]
MTRHHSFRNKQLTDKKTGLISAPVMKILRPDQWMSKKTSLVSGPVMKTLVRSERILTTTVDNAVAEPPIAATVESDYVVILAALLCAVICVVGLIAVARCAWLRRGSVANGGGRSSNQQNYNKGMKKKMIEVIPKFTYDADVREDEKSCSSECAICLGEYVKGDEIRVLPQCGHRFHVGCVDTWLSSHSSCPSCRQVLVARRCKKCGEFPTSFDGNVVVDKCSSSSRDYLP